MGEDSTLRYQTSVGFEGLHSNSPESIRRWDPSGWHYVIWLLGIVGGYLGLALVGRAIFSQKLDAAILWPAAGFAIGVILRTERKHWPVVIAAIFFTNYLSDRIQQLTAFASFSFSLADALDLTIASFLVSTFDPGGWGRLRSLRSIMIFLIGSAIIGPAVSAAGGSAYLTFVMNQGEFASNWFTWFLSNLTGVMILGTFILFVGNDSKKHPLTIWKLFEGILFSVLIIVFTLVVFGTVHEYSREFIPLPFLIFPVFIAIVFRYSAYDTWGMFTVFTGLSVYFTSRQYGPFMHPDFINTLGVLEYQIFIIVLGGTLLAIIGVELERRGAFDELGTSQTNYTHAAQMASMGFWTMEIGSQELKLSKELAGILGGIQQSQTNLNELRSIIHPDDWNRVHEKFLRSIGRNDQYTDDFRILRADGTVGYLHAVATLTKDLEGNALRWVGMIQDISAIKSAELTLQDTQKQLLQQLSELNQLYSTSPVGLFLVNNDQVFLRVNDEIASMNQLSSISHIGRTVEDVNRELSDRLHPFFRSVIENRTSIENQDLTLHTAGPPGSEKTFIVNLHPVIDENGSVNAILGALVDISFLKQTQQELEKSERKFRALVNSMDEAVFTLDRDGCYTGIYGRYYEKYHLSPELFLGREFGSHFGRLDLEKHRDARRRALDGESVLYESTTLMDNGETLHSQNSLTPLLDETGAIIGSVGIARDITQQNKMETRLKELYELYSRFIEASPDGIVVVNLEGIVTFASSTAYDLYGYSLGDTIIGTSVFDLMIPTDQERAKQSIARIIRGDRFTDHIYGMIRKDGSTFSCEVSSAVLRDGSQQPAGTISILRDVTEKIENEGRLRRLNLAVEQLAEAVLVTDADGRIQYANAAIERLTGYTPDEVMNQTPQLFKSGEHSKDFYQQLWSTVLAGSVWSGQIRNRRKDGTMYDEYMTIAPVRNSIGRIDNFIAIKRDISEEIRLESQLRQAQKMEAIGRLAGGIAHDFNNLLAGILGYTELALTSAHSDPSMVSKLQHIYDASERAAALTRQLLAFSRKQTLSIGVLNLNKVVSKFSTMLQRIIGEDIKYRVNLATDVWNIKADRSQLEQVLINLFINSRDAMPEGGTLSVETTNVVLDEQSIKDIPDAVPGSYVQLTVADTGIGMAPDVLKRIFEPFYTTKAIGKGTGLGLSTVYGIVSQHGGHITVSSEAGKGTTFRVFFPRTSESLPYEAIHDHSLLRPTDYHETILLVEDEEIVRQMAIEILEGLGYTVMAAVDSEDALSKLEKFNGSLDLLITDVVLPGETGRDLARRIKAKYSTIRVLFMSGYTEDIIANHGVLDEGVEFISKPFTVNNFEKKVRQVLS